MLNKRLLKFFIKALVSGFFLWWIIFEVNWGEVGEYLKRLESSEIILYMAFYLGGMFFSARKLQFLAQLRGINLPLKEFFKSYFSATFVNNFMPSFVGGDSYKIYHIGKLVQKFKEAASSVIMDRLTGLLGGMFLVVIFSVLNFSVVAKNEVLLVLSSLALVSLLGVFIFLGIYRKKEFRSPFIKLNIFLNKLLGEINHYNGEKNHIWKALGFSFLFNLVGLAGANGILFWALDIDISILNYLSVIFLASVVSSVPISINNIGVKEWAYITFFGIFGLSASAVISVAIISRILQMLLSFVAVPIYLKDKKV
ncbi:MAG: lysylphosphatidylglycerol synthase transmembrane domain-containing protein [Candidatus Moranbacteria bacterium]|jgi:uncharacterized protein (TIRG00374 family)|nr:lysylphosphatidylglycerol synthase transmembrane domain-containing protein [Candidatus Moranbacteria bacterium]